jgi:CrcB protein
MEKLFYIMIGGGIGSVLRYVVTSILKRCSFEHYATFWVNITGCFVLGLLLSKLQLFTHNNLYYFLIVGICASYTTFSTFEYENIDLIAHEKYVEFLKYTVLSCCCGLTSILVGFVLGFFI